MKQTAVFHVQHMTDFFLSAVKFLFSCNFEETFWYEPPGAA